MKDMYNYKAVTFYRKQFHFVADDARRGYLYLCSEIIRLSHSSTKHCIVYNITNNMTGQTRISHDTYAPVIETSAERCFH